MEDKFILIFIKVKSHQDLQEIDFFFIVNILLPSVGHHLSKNIVKSFDIADVTTILGHKVISGQFREQNILGCGLSETCD